MHIETEEINGTIYFTMTSRATNYTLYQDSTGDWCLHSQRAALGRYNDGSYRTFKTLEQIESVLKAFRGISQIIPELV